MIEQKKAPNSSSHTQKLCLEQNCSKAKSCSPIISTPPIIWSDFYLCKKKIKNGCVSCCLWPRQLLPVLRLNWLFWKRFCKAESRLRLNFKKPKKGKMLRVFCFVFFLHIDEWILMRRMENGPKGRRRLRDTGRLRFHLTISSTYFKNGAPRWLTSTWAEITVTDDQHAKFRQ